MAAIVGAAGLKPTLEAVRQGSLTALANKECLVSAGDIFMAEVARAKTTLLPVDSEHSAAMQVMAGCRPETYRAGLPDRLGRAVPVAGASIEMAPHAPSRR